MLILMKRKFSVEHVTLDLGVMSLNPMLGVELKKKKKEKKRKFNCYLNIRQGRFHNKKILPGRKRDVS